ncbi:MAG: NAD(P)H-dependent oxidoreductase [Myxococcales bacterium]|nr:NAD(P)H-dependent oxidoreductase [Myxococcales bacterium]
MDGTQAQRFLFVLGSTRVDGNSERLAHVAATRLAAGVSQQWARLIDDPLPPFFDTRHSTGYATPVGAGRRWVEATLAATDVVIVTPVNWYSVAWPVKLYLDHMSGWMRVPALAFAETMAGRSLWAVVVDADDEAAGSAAPVVDALRRTADYLDMRWRGALVGHANRPGDITADRAALAAAETYFTAA